MVPRLSAGPRARRSVPRLIGYVLLVATTSACSDSPTNAWDALPSDASRLTVSPDRDAEFSRAVQAIPPVTGVPQRAGRVIRDSVWWAAAWDSIFARSLTGFVPPLPRVDFATEMLILVSGGPREFGGSIAINGVFESAQGLYALVLDGFPETLCAVPDSPQDDARAPFPVAVALTPRRDGTPQFLSRSGKVRC